MRSFLPRTASEISELHGPAPVSSGAGIHYALGETILAPVQCKSNCLSIDIPQGIDQRKLYGGIWGNAGGNVWQIDMELEFFQSNTSIGRLPWTVINGASSNANSTISALIGVNANSPSDSIQLVLGSPSALRAEPDSVFLNPFYVYGQQITNVRGHVRNASSLLQSMRAILVVVSVNLP